MFKRLFLAALLLPGLAGAASAFGVSSPSLGGGWTAKFVADRSAGCEGGNVSPALTWSDPPAGTKSFALTVFDPDAPGAGFWHWLAWDIPGSATGLPEGAGSGGGALPAGTIQGKGSIGRAGYLGPCPPAGSGRHRYVITLYALSVAALDATPSTPPPDVANAAGKVALAIAHITVPYGR